MRSWPHTLLTALAGLSFATAAPAFELRDAFGPVRDAATKQLIADVTDSAEAIRYAGLNRRDKAAFLDRFWSDRSPVLRRTYYASFLAPDRPNVSLAFTEAEGVLPRDYWSGAPAPDSARIAEAESMLQRLAVLAPGDEQAELALGYCRLEAGRIDEAEAIFRAVLARDRSLPEAHNGLGLVHLKRPGRHKTRARNSFRNAAALGDAYEGARYNLALSQIAMGARDVAFHLDKVTKRFPEHADAWYKLGVFYALKSDFDTQFREPARDRFRRQVEVNPDHHAARSELARMYLELGEPGWAISHCNWLMAKAPAYHGPALGTLVEAYQMKGDVASADSVASRYLATMDAETRALFEDIRFAASEEEMEIFASLPDTERARFRDAFWVRHDPTPATAANERRVEHYRRVGYAMATFSRDAYPWDRRGEVYIRYGEPAHRSKSDNLRFETDPKVIAVRERLLGGLSIDARKEILEFQRRWRMSNLDRDELGESFTNDFEGPEFEREGPRPTGHELAPIPAKGRYSTHTMQTPLDRGVGVDEIRGYPLFPVEGTRPWEYWIYTDVDDGIEVVFAALSHHQPLDYAYMPSGARGISAYNRTVWIPRAAETVMTRAVARQPSMLRQEGHALGFHWSTADFRGGGDSTRVEIYLGVPPSALDSTGHFERGIALFDMRWKPLYRYTESAGDRSRTLDSLRVDEWAVRVPPGEYILAIQVRNPETRGIGFARTAIRVDDYAEGRLHLSDLEMAGAVVADSTSAKGGFDVFPRPTVTYGDSEPVTVYYEVYGLTPDAFGQTRYRMDYEVRSREGGALAVRVLRAVGRALAGSGQEAMTVSFEQVGDGATEHNFIEIDMSESEPGAYEVAVTVTDLVSWEKVTKTQLFKRRGKPRGMGLGTTEAQNLVRLPR